MVIVISIAFAVFSAVFGVTVVAKLSTGGFTDSSAQSTHAESLLANKFGVGESNFLLLATAPSGGGVDINAFEGGTVTTHNAELAAKARSLHYFGYTPEGDITAAGINAKMPEACAAMGLTSLEDLPEISALDRAHHAAYTEHLADLPGIRVRQPGPGERSNYQFVAIEIDPAAAGLDRDELAETLTAENVLVRKHFHPGIHRFGPYRDNPARHVRRPLTQTEALGRRVMQLPTGTGITPDEVVRVCRLIELAVG